MRLCSDSCGDPVPTSKTIDVMWGVINVKGPSTYEWRPIMASHRRNTQQKNATRRTREELAVLDAIDLDLLQLSAALEAREPHSGRRRITLLSDQMLGLMEIGAAGSPLSLATTQLYFVPPPRKTRFRKQCGCVCSHHAPCFAGRIRFFTLSSKCAANYSNRVATN